MVLRERDSARARWIGCALFDRFLPVEDTHQTERVWGRTGRPGDRRHPLQVTDGPGALGS